MKKLFSFVCILFLGVISSACVNMFAVSELNQIAKEYLDEGNVQAAISRLESSVDLDGEIYESRYNLAVSYLRTDNCKGAQEQIEVALTLRSNEPAALYTAGVAYTCVATEIYEKKDKDGNIEFIKYDDLQKDYVAALDYIKYLELANDFIKNDDFLYNVCMRNYKYSGENQQKYEQIRLDMRQKFRKIIEDDCKIKKSIGR